MKDNTQNKPHLGRFSPILHFNCPIYSLFGVPTAPPGTFLRCTMVGGPPWVLWGASSPPYSLANTTCFVTDITHGAADRMHDVANS